MGYVELNIQKPFSSDLLNKLKMQGLGTEGILFQGNMKLETDDDDIECEDLGYISYHKNTWMIPHNMNTI